MTKNTIYQPTFLEKILGRNYKWWYLMLFYHKRQTTHTFDNLMWILSASFRLFGSIYLWLIFSPNNSKEIFTYLFFGNLFLQLTANYTGFALGYDILSGKIANVLLYPQSLVKYYFCRSFGGTWYASSMYFAIFFVSFFIFLEIFNFTGIWELNFEFCIFNFSSNYQIFHRILDRLPGFLGYPNSKCSHGNR